MKRYTSRIASSPPSRAQENGFRLISPLVARILPCEETAIEPDDAIAIAPPPAPPLSVHLLSSEGAAAPEPPTMGTSITVL